MQISSGQIEIQARNRIKENLSKSSSVQKKANLDNGWKWVIKKSLWDVGFYFTEMHANTKIAAFAPPHKKKKKFTLISLFPLRRLCDRYLEVFRRNIQYLAEGIYLDFNMLSHERTRSLLVVLFCYCSSLLFLYNLAHSLQWFSDQSECLLPIGLCWEAISACICTFRLRRRGRGRWEKVKIKNLQWLNNLPLTKVVISLIWLQALIVCRTIQIFTIYCCCSKTLKGKK